MKKQTGKQTQSSRVVEAQSESKHSPLQRIEREGSPSREQRPKPNGKKRFSTYYGYRSGKAGSRRSIPIMSRKSLVSRYYQLKCGYAPRRISSGSGSEMMISAGGAERRPGARASLPPLQEVAERAAVAVESSRERNRLESGKMQAHANIGAVFPGDV